METKDFLKGQLDDVGYQLGAVFEGLPDSQWSERATEHSMSAAETAEHLGECYTALLAHADGHDHEWGSFKIEDKSPANLYKTMMELRNKAVEAATSKTDAELNKLGNDYVLLHDAYHVGQMVTLRLNLGEFNPYSIYKSS